jgi:hypothetical protein
VIAPHIGFGKGYRGQDDKLFCHWFSVQNDFLNQADYGGQNAAGEHFSRADPDGVVLSAHWVAVYQVHSAKGSVLPRGRLRLCRLLS